MTGTIEEIKEKIEKLKDEVKIKMTEINRLQVRKLEMDTGFKEGDIIISNKGEKAKIVCAEIRWSSIWKIRKFKKDGEPSKTFHYLHDWDKWKKVE